MRKSKVKNQLFSFGLIIFTFINWIILKIFNKQIKNCYEKSASVCNIWFRNKPPNAVEMSSANLFLCTHTEFTHPDIVLADNISLFYLTKDEAIFVDCRDFKVFDPKYTFVYYAQYEYASRLIILPIESFHLIASQIPKPTVPILHVANHGRCGSTLLSKVFEAIPNCFTVSEMLAFSCITNISRKGLVDCNQLRRLCFSSIMLMLKHSNASKANVVFFKCQSFALYITNLMMDAVPSIKHIYMYREPIPFIRSWEKLFAVNHWPEFSSKKIKKMSGIGHNELLINTPIYPYHVLDKLHFVSKLSLVWVTSTAAFNRLLQKGYPIKSFKYEDLLSEPKRNILALLDYIGAKAEWIPDLEAIFSNDSQAGTQFSSRRFKESELKVFYTEFTDELRSELDDICHDFGVPLIWNDIHLSEKV